MPGRVIVRFAPGTSIEKQDEILQSAGASRREQVAQVGAQLLELPLPADEAATVQRLRALPEVVGAELNRIVHIAGVTANDPLFSNQKPYLDGIGVPAAWSMSTGTNVVTIAYLDTGVGPHPDLTANMVAGWNFVDNNSNAQDVHGHGTLTAGLASAVGNNGMDIAGIAWNSKIMPIRVGGLDGTTTLFDITNGLVWAADHGARVACVGFAVGDTVGTALSSAAQYFMNHGGVVVAPVGNTSVNLTYANDPNILTVSGLEFGGTLLWSLSCWGTPVDMSSTCTFWTMYPGGGAMLTAGSSYAASSVSGVAALVLAVKPSLSGAQLRDLLVQSTDDVGTIGWDPIFGAGRLDAERALSMAGGVPSGGGGGGGAGTLDTSAPSVQITSPNNAGTVHSKTTIKATASDNVGVTRVEFFVDGVLRGTDSAAAYQYVWRSDTAASGAHTLLCKAYDAAGNVGLSPVVTVYR